jgi:hypothetical protein
MTREQLAALYAPHVTPAELDTIVAGWPAKLEWDMPTVRVVRNAKREMRNHGAPGRARQTAGTPHGGLERGPEHAGPLREIAGRVGHDEQGEAHSERRDYRPAALEPTRRATP